MSAFQLTSEELQDYFSTPLLHWYDLHGRKNLPWQSPREAYRVWVSEIMLQQTQVKTVIPYFNRFIQSFPTIQALAQAQDDEVLALWSGLGYYSRARNLHHTAKIINSTYDGIFPRDLDYLKALPGIGPSTAAAILSQAFNQPTAILDGNVKRVLTRFFALEGQTERAPIKKMLWDLAQKCMPTQRCAEYTQAIMDLGATCCTTKKPQCMKCPLNTYCKAYQSGEQHLYPSKKIKRPLPLHHQQFLVLSNNEGLIYLEKRPPVGLWGGLWCLPSIDEDLCPLNFIKKHYALKGQKPEPLLQLKHRFSHFQLSINALHIKTQSLGHHISEANGIWVKPEQWKKLGLAKPISVILARIS